MEQPIQESCLTVWVTLELKEAFDREVHKTGLNRSIVMRQLVKRWVIQRTHGGQKNHLALEELV